ncbi:uncharacterized protein Tco025E_05571 [Trypanosoma conorhini]|uniref:Uncharacterized protein n=1 Tax=Trypanosoma conorhini TaxID=83891 RepID=A0A422PC64_9TRYP|nr:uncharacterized protein Tco025E_05571 [Trypanosoma conorhini]RNF15301.1 hypothetical protein Tco025E_05571 [Trypanosoma conorhini]
MATQCVAKCGGYRSLRAECARDPCLAQGMCKLMDVGIRDCAEWCCVGRGGYVFLTVLFFCGGTCALFSMYYLWRLHRANVAAGAVTETGEKVEVPPESDPRAVAAQQRRKRQVTVDPELLRAIGLSPPEDERQGVGRYREC